MDWKVKYIDYPKQFKNHEKEFMDIIYKIWKIISGVIKMVNNQRITAVYSGGVLRPFKKLSLEEGEKWR